MGCKIVTMCASNTANRDAKQRTAKYVKEGDHWGGRSVPNIIHPISVAFERKDK